MVNQSTNNMLNIFFMYVKSFSVFVKEDILISFVKSFATSAVLLLILFTWNQFRFCLFVRHERHPEFYVKLFAAAARETGEFSNHCHTNYFPSNQFIVKFFSKRFIWRNFCDKIVAAKFRNFQCETVPSGNYGYLLSFFCWQKFRFY